MDVRSLRILIVAEHASARFGGEAALPLHYYRVLRARGIPVWLLTHARVRDELAALYPQDLGSRIRFVEDTAFHRLMWRVGERLPARLAYASVGFLSRLSTQRVQRRQARALVREEAIDVVHQPMPVSPREPSMLYGLGAPVLIGPMNGGMSYPPAFRREQSLAERAAVSAGRALAWAMSLAMPGKRRAAALLVANRRTRDALPPGSARQVVELVENGVDFSLWRAPAAPQAEAAHDGPPRFVFLGRLVDWKAVDLLIEAFAGARLEVPMQLTIVGDGPEMPSLRALADRLGLGPDTLHFTGWMDQAGAVGLLARQDVLVLPSLYECGGAVVLEAMALGLPVIATDWGGPSDYLDPSCGELVPPTSREALREGLSQAMQRLARDPQRRREMGRAGQAKARRLFDWESKVDEVLRLYRQCAAPRTPVVARA